MARVVRVSLGGRTDSPPIGATDLGVHAVQAHVYERPADGALYLSILDTQDIATKLASNELGKRWIPFAKPAESKNDFIARAKGKDPDFDFNVWSQKHEQELRAELPDNFKGDGW